MHRLTEFSLKRPWLTLAILLAITAVLGVGVPKVKQAYGFRVLVGDDHPAVRTLDDMITEFVGGYPIRIAWECGVNHPCETAYDKHSLEMADELTKELSMFPLIRNVQSPTNTPLLVPSDTGFSVSRFVEHGQQNPEVSRLSERALSDPLWKNTVISEDGTVGLILVQTKDNLNTTSVEVFDYLKAALQKHEAQGFVFYMVGDVPESVSGGRALANSTSRLVPYLVSVIALVLLALTRSWKLTLSALVTMGVAVVWALGLLGWLGWPRDAILQVLLPVIVIVGVCDSLHLLTFYARNVSSLPSESSCQTALERAARSAASPCTITTLTTVFAFLSFTTSSLDTFFRFGFISAFGVLSCLALTFSLLPMTVDLLNPAKREEGPDRSSWTFVISSISRSAQLRSNTLLIVSGLILIFFGFGWSRLDVDQNWVEGYGENHPFVQSVRFMEEKVGLSQTLEIVIDLPPDSTLVEPSTLNYIDTLSRELSSSSELNETTSIVNLISHVNRLLNNDDPEYDVVGKSASANAEILELLRFEDPEAVGRWVSVDQSRIRLSIEASERSSNERASILSEVSQKIKKTLPENWGISLSGEMAMSNQWARDVQATQLRSFPIAFGIVFILVSVFLRSWKLGLAAMVPTLLPVVVVLGAMGWIGMSLDVARAMLAAVVIGIGVDDAIHLLAHYKVRRDAGDDPHAAIAAALQHTGRAIVTTSVALALGFLTLMMSAWQTVASFGFFVAIAIMGALVATLFVLPALIFAFTKGQKADPT